MFKKDIGNFGEQKAIEYLTLKGYSILERNYRCRYGEIDIVAKHNCEYIFVEVRTFDEKGFVGPVDSVFKKKRKKILKTILHYINERGIIGECRIDIVGIRTNGGKTVKKITHIEDAFWEEPE